MILFTFITIIKFWNIDCFLIVHGEKIDHALKRNIDDDIKKEFAHVLIYQWIEWKWLDDHQKVSYWHAEEIYRLPIHDFKIMLKSNNSLKPI